MVPPSPFAAYDYLATGVLLVGADGRISYVNSAAETLIGMSGALLVGQAFDSERVLAEWRRLAVHSAGDRVSCVLGDRTVSGAWAGIDEYGRAVLRNGEGTTAVSAGDLILQ